MLNLREIRKEHGLTQEKLAKIIGLSRSTITMYETGGSEPDFDILKKIADYFNVTTDYLLYGNLSRATNIKPMHALVKLPVLGCIRAGSPIFAEEHIEGYQMVDKKYEKGYFLLRVDGTSMSPTIPNNAVVIVRQQNTAESGDIVACLVNGDCATLKRFKPLSNGVFLLQADNPSAESYTVSAADFESGYAQILGVAEEFTMKLGKGKN